MSERDFSPLPREARPYQGTPAGIVTRAVANVIDAAVVAVVLGLGYVGIAAGAFILDPLSFQMPAVGFLLSFTAAVAVSIGYLWLAWWLVGRSYGGHVMGLRVRGYWGRRLGPLRALARAAFCVLFPVGLLWCVVSPKRRSVQDIVLWTAVVYDWLPADHGGPSEQEPTGASDGPDEVGDPGGSETPQAPR